MDRTSERNNVDLRIMRSKKAFIDALSVLCHEKEITDITITDIVERASYSRKTFYAHYSSKEDFLISIVDAEVGYYVDELCKFHPVNRQVTNTKAADPSTLLMIKLFQHVYDNRELYKLILEEKLFQHTTDYLCEKAFSEYCRQSSKKAGSYPAKQSDDDFDSIEFYYYTRIYHLLVIVKFWIKNNFKFSPKYIAEQEMYLRNNSVVYSKD